MCGSSIQLRCLKLLPSVLLVTRDDIGLLGDNGN